MIALEGPAGDRRIKAELLTGAPVRWQLVVSTVGLAETAREVLASGSSPPGRFSVMLPPGLRAYEGALFSHRVHLAVDGGSESLCVPLNDRLTGSRSARFPAHANPFRHEAVRALGWQMADQDWQKLFANWQKTGRRGAILGRHGAGKSTLLRALGDRLAADGQAVTVIRLTRPRSPADRRDLSDRFDRLGPNDTLLLDSAGNLDIGELWRLRRLKLAGLIVTGHRLAIAPTVFRLRADPDRFADLAEQLLPGCDAAARAAFARHRGNMRDALTDLYRQWARHGGRGWGAGIDPADEM